MVKTDIEKFDLTQIPLSSEKRIGSIFREGEIKYDRNNWRKGVGNLKYQLERANHALKHLKTYIHLLEHGEYIGELKDGKREDDLAKVGWFVATQCEIERLEENYEDSDPEPKLENDTNKEEEKQKEEKVVKENVFVKALKAL